MTAAVALAPPRRCVRRIPATSGAVRRLLGDLPALCDLSGLAAARRIDLHILLAELLNNVVEHAVAGHPGGWVELRLAAAPRGLSITLADNGTPLPCGLLNGAPWPRASAQDAHCEGGYGWPMIHALCDGLRHERRNGVNRLRLAFPACRTG